MSKLFGLILSVILIGCSYANGNPPKTSTVVLAPIDTTTLMEQPKETNDYSVKVYDAKRKTYGEDNWSFNLVGNDWEIESAQPLTGYAMSFISVHSNSKLVAVALVKEDRLDQNALEFNSYSVGYLNQTAANIDKSYQIVYNGNTFTYSHFIFNGMRELVWTTVKGNYGYIMTCLAQKNTENICNQAIETLEIL